MKTSADQPRASLFSTERPAEATTQQDYHGTDNLVAMTEARYYNDFLVREVLRHAGNATTAVDFGAGSGTFSRMLRERGLDVVCIELDPQLRADLRSQGFVCHESVQQMAENSVDYIFSLNVLEHIEDDNAALESLFRRLRPGGVLYLYLPAFPVLFSVMDRKVGHFRRYRKSQIKKQLRQAGFEVSTARYTDSVGFAVTMLYQWVGNRRGDLNLKALRFYDRWLFPVSRLLDKVLGRVLGKNVTVAAIRPAEPERISPPAFSRSARSPVAR